MISFLNAALPVTLVRSPILIKREEEGWVMVLLFNSVCAELVEALLFFFGTREK